ncbi:hypothetical protein AFNJKBDN_CDS0033 [Halorubrum virus V_ICIS4]|nr:hypothetical protein AFNJKBDN_CDS0033 [Halorubrum virus V_ICIS4]
MRMNRIPSGGEMLLLFLTAIGAVTVGAFILSLASQAVVWLLSASLIAQLQHGLPWLLAGVAIGIALAYVAVVLPHGGDSA